MAVRPGGVPERPKGTGCKPVGSAYGGSNPPAPIALACEPRPPQGGRAATTAPGLMLCGGGVGSAALPRGGGGRGGAARGGSGRGCRWPPAQPPGRPGPRRGQRGEV